MGKRHKWADVIVAWSEGAEIEGNSIGFNEWDDEISPLWDAPTKQYRIKPQPKEPQYLYAWLVKDEERIDFYFDKPEGVLNDDYHQYIGKIKLEQDDE